MFDNKKLVILDADGTTIDAFEAITVTFVRNHMKLGDLYRFQKRHNLFKYIGGVKEFPRNIKKQIKKIEREKLIDTLTDVYREEAFLYSGMVDMIQKLIDHPEVIVGVVTRNITRDPVDTLKTLFNRNGIPADYLDFIVHLELRQNKTETFRAIRKKYKINPALSYVCGDEYKDYKSAVSAGLVPFIASYGFESFERLTQKYEIPEEVIFSTPLDLKKHLFHALNIQV